MKTLNRKIRALLFLARVVIRLAMSKPRKFFLVCQIGRKEVFSERLEGEQGLGGDMENKQASADSGGGGGSQS